MTEVSFIWSSGGYDVKIAGSFNKWEPLSMIKVNDKWIYRTNLCNGNYTYKFIADDKWYYDSKLPIMVDSNGITNNIMVVDDNKYKAQSIISINDDCLVLKKIISNNEDIKIVSILGSARMGKSTLFNTIISKYTNHNNNVFATSKTLTHCTHGIDFVYVPGLKIIFCDVQGLNSENSANDPKLLLISYLMSDIIIFTEQKMLNKTTLQSMSPLSTFLTYFDPEKLKRKPSLVFRISDYMLDGTPQENLTQLLTEHEDQSKNLVINMRKLFKDINAYKTNPLDRSELKMLDTGNFYGLLENDENGFNAFISELNEYLSKIPSRIKFDKWYSDLDNYIKDINGNKKIDFNKLDVYQLVAQNELLEYIDNLRKTKPDLFKEINVDHTQKDYTQKIMKRIKERDLISLDFETKFKVVNDNLKTQKLKSLIDELNKPIDNALRLNYEIGMNIFNSYCKSAFEKLTIAQLTLEIGDLDVSNSLEFLKKNDMNEQVLKVFNEWYERMTNLYKKKKSTLIDLQKKEIEQYKTKIEKYVDNILPFIKKTILENDFKDSVNEFLRKSYDEFVDTLISYHTGVINNFFNDHIQYQLIINTNKTQNFNDYTISFEVINNKVDPKYKYFSEIYEVNKKTLIYLCKGQDTKDMFITKKKQILSNKKYYDLYYCSNRIGIQGLTDIARINKDICEFYESGGNKSLLPLSLLKKKILVKETCKQLIKEKLIYKKNDMLFYNGIKYTSYKRLALSLYNERDNGQIFNNIVEMNNIRRNNYIAFQKSKQIKPKKEKKKTVILDDCNIKIMPTPINLPRSNTIFRYVHIPKSLKKLVWDTYIGRDIGIAKCLCCKNQEIRQIEFHCGHIVSRATGGQTILENLKPICAQCNLSMGKMNMDEFKKTYFPE